MSKPFDHHAIRLRGVRHNNLKNFDLDLPFNQLIVITGLSGSGKSSLAFDTLFAEGQRRYIETFSPYARQFFDRMDKPQVDSVEGIPPAIAIEQRNAVRTTRSTVGTMTEICDYMKTLWPQIAQLFCRNCARPVSKDSPRQIWEAVQNSEFRLPNCEALVTFDLPLAEKLSLEESIGLITKQGYQRLLVPAGRKSGLTNRLPSLELNESKAPWGRTQSNPRLTPSRSGNHPADAGQFPSWEGPGVGAQPSPAMRGLDFEIVRADEAVERLKELHPTSLTVVQDRIKVAPENRSRFVEACEQAYHFGKGKLAVHFAGAGAASTLQAVSGSTMRFSNRFHCAQCDIEYREPSSALFSFNHPLGACPACRGFGRIISIDYDLALPDRSKTLAEGVVKPWLGGHGVESQQDLMKFCKIRKAPTDVPFERLSKKWQDWVIYGDPDYGKDADHEWPRAWYGVKGYFRWLESKAYKMHVRVLLSRYRAYTPCPDCQGKRFQPEALLYTLPISDFRFTNRPLNEGAGRGEDASIVNRKSKISLADFYQLPVRDALRFIDRVTSRHRPKPSDPIGLVLTEVRSRLGYLDEVGLGYLTLDRPTRTLSGGETERVNLTTCLGTRLVNTLYVLDEPSVGLHPRDTGRLIKILEHLRDLGNTVVVVEHEASVIRAANRIIDLGPGHGESGGQLVFQGTCKEILRSEESITGQYLSGRKRIDIPERRSVKGAADVPSADKVLRARMAGPHCRQDAGSTLADPALRLTGATLHNLKNISVEIPLGRLVCVTGVSGSGKTTLVREVLLPALEARLRSRIADAKSVAKASDRFEEENDDEDEDDSTSNPRPATHISGWEHLGRAVLVDQSPLGKTPRSNPAVYIGAFDDIRELFAQTDAARQRGLNASAFSFNSTQGQCERCRGAGFEKIEMQFLSDVFVRCPDCNGRRYRPHILEVKVSSSRREEAPSSQSKAGKRKSQSLLTSAATQEWSIADLLDATVDEVIGFLNSFPDSRPAQRAVDRLRLLEEVGLGYLRLGQPINTLSGGESQRLKLVSHLAENVAADVRRLTSKPQIEENPVASASIKPTLFLFDEPTTGLHFDDIRVLLKAFQRLVDGGHSVLVIEHNLDVIKCADWIIDLGPDAGDEGGHVVAEGTPEDIAASPSSHTGRFLREILAGPGNAFSSDASPDQVLQRGGNLNLRIAR